MEENGIDLLLYESPPAQLKFKWLMQHLQLEVVLLVKNK